MLPPSLFPKTPTMFRALAHWFSRHTAWLISLLVMLPVLVALLPGGLPNSADGMVHFTRITEIVSSWRDGILIPRWSLNLGFGYGVPVFIFGPPLAYWLGALYNVIGFGPEASYKAMLVTILLIGTTGSYQFGKLLLGVWAGVVAAVMYLYAPNQLFTLFVQGNAPQLLAWSFFPWTLWTTLQIFRATTPRAQLCYGGVLALTVGSTLISHNVVSLILVPTVAMLALILWLGTRHHRALFITAAGGALGGIISAWFVVPALMETVYASTDAIVASDYRTRFVPLAELLAWPPPLDAGAINPYIPRTLGLPLVLVALLGVAALVGLALHQVSMRVVHKRNVLADHLPGSFGTSRQVDEQVSGEIHGRSREVTGTLEVPVTQNAVFWATAIFMLLYALLTAFMAVDASAPVWERLPLLDFFQFPARWIGFAAFPLAWLAAAVVGLMGRRWQPILAVIFCMVLVTSAMVYLNPDKTPVGTRKMSPYDVVRYELRSGAIGTTSYGEFNPRWAPRPLPPSPMVDDYMARLPVDRLKGMLPAGASHEVLQVNAHRQRYQLTLPAPATISLNLLYFPGWRATVNGAPAEIAPQEGTGLITVALPAGESVLDLTFGPTPLRRAMAWLSIGGWLVLLGGLVRLAFRPAPDKAMPATDERGAGRVLFTVGGLMAGLLAVQIGGASWFQLASPPDQALAAPIPRHDDVGESFRLLGQNPLPTTVTAGDTLPVVVYWRSLDDNMEKNYGAVLRLADVGSGQIIIEGEQSHPNDIPTSGWATGLYVRNAWSLLIPAEALPVQYAVQVGMRDPDTGEMLSTSEGNTIELGRIWILPQTLPQPYGAPRVSFGPDIELLGAHAAGESLTLYWRANSAITSDYGIFVHLRDANGTVIGQLDGVPFDNRYPVWAWLPGQIVEDRRSVAAAGVDPAQIHHVAVGFYDRASGTRLVATDANGEQLPDNAINLPWSQP